jgi:hypothetical protein
MRPDGGAGSQAEESESQAEDKEGLERDEQTNILKRPGGQDTEGKEEGEGQEPGSSVELEETGHERRYQEKTGESERARHTGQEKGDHPSHEVP